MQYIPSNVVAPWWRSKWGRLRAALRLLVFTVVVTFTASDIAVSRTSIIDQPLNSKPQNTAFQCRSKRTFRESVAVTVW